MNKSTKYGCFDTKTIIELHDACMNHIKFLTGRVNYYQKKLASNVLHSSLLLECYRSITYRLSDTLADLNELEDELKERASKDESC